jgi:CubicO group peptidase (beta-lactamase class C family)
MIPSLGLIVVCAEGTWDDLKPSNPASKINQALKLAAEAAGYHATQPASLSPKEYFPPPDPEGGWRSLSTAEEIRRVAGMDKNTLDEAYRFAEGSSTNGALLVLRHGWLVYERYFGRGHREALCNLASCGKSFTSIAVGALMAERPELFPDSLDQKIFTPAYLPPEAFPLSDPAKADIKLGHLLCFSAGIRGNNPCYVNGRRVTIDPIGPDGYKAVIDAVALGRRDMTNRGELVSAKTLWCKPGGGYSYATASAHIASIIVRQVSGMELEEYVRTRLAKPMGWGRFTYAYKQYPAVNHSPGGGGIAVRPTDVLRFGYLLLREGHWKDRQLVPADYVRQCGQKSSYNPHYPYSLQFTLNANGMIPGLPRDMYFKQGAGGHVLWIVPSLDLVVWRLAGRNDQYDEANTGLPLLPEVLKGDESRKGWKATSSRGSAERDIIKKVVESVVEPRPSAE